MGKLRFFVGAFFLTTQLWAGERLVLVGGGTRPAAASERFVKWAGGANAQLLLITWASEGYTPEEFFEATRDDLNAFHPAAIQHAVTKPDVVRDRDTLVTQIQGASGIFFTGGDQNFIMDVLADDAQAHLPQDSLLTLLRQRYQAGVVFGGTSAGTAVMSSPMLSGAGDLTVWDGTQVGVRGGLGLVADAIFDQHFMAQGRLLRLMGLMEIHPDKIGFGVDEATALLIEDGRYAEVVGDSHVLGMWWDRKEQLLKTVPLTNGAHFDLVKRSRY